MRSETARKAEEKDEDEEEKREREEEREEGEEEEHERREAAKENVFGEGAGDVGGASERASATGGEGA